MRRIAQSFRNEISNVRGQIQSMDSGTIDDTLLVWDNFSKKLDECSSSGTLMDNVVSTFSLTYTGAALFRGGVLSLNGDIHFIPYWGARGQKISENSVVSTYSLVYTAINSFSGGVLLPFNGEVLFVGGASRQYVKNNVVATVSVNDSGYRGAVLTPDGNAFLVPSTASQGRLVNKANISASANVALSYTVSDGYWGGVLSPAGDIHLVPHSAAVGQKVSIPYSALTTSSSTATTYSLSYTTANAYAGGVLDHSGAIHFVPYNATVGQKISKTGTVSTYSLAYTTTNAYQGGVITASGEVHFIPYSAAVGQKVSASGVVSTYSLVYTTTSAYSGGVLSPRGEIIFIPYNAAVGQKINTFPGINLSESICINSFYNKY